MSIRTILVPVRGDGKGESVLDHARVVANRFDAHIDVIHARARDQDLMPYGVLMTASMKQAILEASSAQSETEEQRVRDMFNEYCDKAGLTIVDANAPDQTSNTISWREITGKQAGIIGLHGRLADLIVVPKPGTELGHNTLESALMNTGARTLMCPDSPVGKVGDRIALAWNGSVESARVAKATLPFLRKASNVTIVTNDADGSASGIPVTDLQRMLARQGVETDVQPFSAGEDIGASILGAASAVVADLLVMGAYSHSRRREMIMGGATHDIIEQAELPVLMLH